VEGSPLPLEGRSTTWAGRTFASLRRRSYRRFFVGHLVSLVGFWIRLTAQGWLVYELTRSKSALGGISALSLLPFVLFAPFGGVIADRRDRRTLLVQTQVVGALANAALGFVLLFGRVEVWHIAVTAFLVGTVRALEIPVRNALIQDLVGPEDRSNAIALNAAGFQLARVAGPAIGGVLLMLVEPAVCFFVVAVLGSVNAVILPGLEIASPPPRPRTKSVLSQLAEGFRYVRHHRRMRTLLLLVFVTFILMWPYQTFLPAIAVDVLGMDDAGYGILLAVTGVGALLGALWVAGRAGRITATRNVVYGLVWAGAACVSVVGLAQSVVAVLPMLLAAGFFQVAFVATANTLVQESAPDDLRGRVMGIWTLVFGASYPVGSFAMGIVAERVGILWTFVGGAVAGVLVTTWIRWRMPARTEEATAASPEEVAAKAEAAS
jgi:MFS family permease